MMTTQEFPKELDHPPRRSGTAAKSGVAFGSAMAMVMSWSVHHSILWAWLHGMCTWFYVIAYWLGYAEKWTP